MRRSSNLSRFNAVVIVIFLVAIPMLIIAAANPQIPTARPTIPNAPHDNPDRVFLDRADRLYKFANDSFMVVSGNVMFTKGPMKMYCDSAHFFINSESVDAFGNVRMEQGDTLFVYADELNYRGMEQIAYLYADPGKKVRLINKDVTLETDIFAYDLSIELGYYDTGGTLFDSQNRLYSRQGEYMPSTKEANFYTSVHLNSISEKDTLEIITDTLYYNTATHIAILQSPSQVINQRGIIYTNDGVYNTDSGLSTLYNRSLIVTKDNQTITADTLIFNRTTSQGHAYGNLIITDSIHQAQITGEYGFYNQLTDSVFITGKTTLMEYSKGDTLYAHGRYLETFRLFDTINIEADTLLNIPEQTRIDTSHVAILYPRVRFYRSDLQGLCDSLRFTEKDSTARMFIHPVVWNEQRQIFGKVIEVHFNDSTVDRVKLPLFGFSAEQIEDQYYNQISGKEMLAIFQNNELKQIDISGNVEIVMYPTENDSTFNKVVKSESSYLKAIFNGRTTEYIKMWPETTGVAIPLFLTKKTDLFLPSFKWFESLRPRNKDDIYVISEEMESILSTAPRDGLSE